MKRNPGMDPLLLSPLGTARGRLDPGAALPPAAAAALHSADLGAEEAFLVWQLTATAEGLGAAERQTLAGLVADSLVAVAQGSTRVQVPEEARAMFARITDLVGPPGSRRPLVLEGPYLYHHRHFTSETRIAALVRARAAAPALWSSEAIARAVAAVMETARPAPTAEQGAAVQAALERRLAVIAGAPGTGKTTIAVTLLRALALLGVPVDAVALTAPTGKAANRLEEAVREGLAAAAAAGGGNAPATGESGQRPVPLAAPPSAATLHRLLGYSPSARAFAYHEASPLPHRVVIVDESSMVDLVLMDHLLRALPPSASLVLLGDADQLPSVEAGAVFRDLAIAPLVVELSHSHRLDRNQPRARRILDLAAAVRAPGGAGAGAAIEPRSTAADLVFEGPELLPASEREPLLERWYEERVAASPELERLRTATLPLGEAGFPPEVEARLDALQAHYQRFRMLAVTRGRPTGALALNSWMHRRLGASTDAPIPGEPLLMLRNDYDRALWNGDQGLCVRVRQQLDQLDQRDQRDQRDSDGRPARAAAAFKVSGRWTAWPIESLRDSLTFAFALTVHKAQGSEHDDIALFLPETPLPLTSRELLYTALTRSRRSVILCAHPDILAAAITHTPARSTGLPEKLGFSR
jgi:exodeoxyribonuclease V alpha subunit